MKKFLLTTIIAIAVTQPSFAGIENWLPESFAQNWAEHSVSKVLKSQVRYANSANFEKFISTYDPQYVNSDGFNLDMYSKLVKDIWDSYDGIKYDIKILDINVNGDKAEAHLLESAFADIQMAKVYKGELKSLSSTIYNLEKKNGKWKVVSDTVLDETTSMLYGDAKGLDIKLSVPEEVAPDTDYTASLEFVPPKETMAIASIASDKVEYPQKPTKEVFRAFPEDNILERILTSNNDNVDEYVIASIGLTKTNVENLDIKLSLTGFGYAIRRVNVNHENLPQNEGVE